jgi:gentisate 1,2-dioxygenase
MASVTKTNGVNVIAGNGLGPNTRIISLTKAGITTTAIADLNAAVQYLTAGDVAGTNDAHSVAGVDHTATGVAHVVLQGTGAFTAAANFGTGATGVTSALVATFTD